MATHLNINSLRLKFGSFVQKIADNVDILVISEIKLGNSFPEGKFLIEGYSKLYRIDRNWHGGETMLCKNKYFMKTSVHRVVTNARFLCRDKPSEKEMVAMLFLQPK